MTTYEVNKVCIFLQHCPEASFAEIAKRVKVGVRSVEKIYHRQSYVFLTTGYNFEAKKKHMQMRMKANLKAGRYSNFR